MGDDLISPGIGRVPGARKQISRNYTIRLKGFYPLTYALCLLYPRTLSQFSTAGGCLAVLVLALYINSDQAS